METIRKVEMRNIKLAIAFVALNIGDAALTIIAANRGIVAEANPIMRYFLEQPQWVFWWVKVNTILICTLVLLLLSVKYPQQIKRIFIVLIAVMLGVCLFNIIGLM